MSDYQPIENYGIIGNLHTVALVGHHGSIDFLCLPRFDSPSVFAGLLDRHRGGHFLIQPHLGTLRNKQLYLPNTNVLLTRFLSEAGMAEITDFMPAERYCTSHSLVRRVSTVRGEIRFRLSCLPRFDYARAEHQAEMRGQRVYFRSRGPDGTTLVLRTSVPLRVEDGAAVGEFTLRAGESADFVLQDGSSGAGEEIDLAQWCGGALEDTIGFWRGWVRQSSQRGRWSETWINRSALTLKMLTSREYGSIVAAPTFGLPEALGGARNWDYRYTWIRDSSFTIYAFIRLGYHEEARAFLRWIEERCGGAEPRELQTMYGVDGHTDLTEYELPHLEGYGRSAPVRIGNGASTQLQLDIYGELMDSVYLCNKFVDQLDYDLWETLVRLVNWVCENWRRPDEGIWEVRGGQKHFLYSRVMCWVAVDRAVRLAWNGSRDAPLDRWVRTRNVIYRDIFENFWNPELGSFVQHQGSRALDASCLLMPMVRFIGPRDPRWLSTLAAIERELVEGTLVYRYRQGHAADDGFTGAEGSFNMCSFWYVECLSRAGQLDKARLTFEKMLGYASPLGLYSEELGPCGEHLGNYPQAFTHLALISAAYDLDRRLDGAGHA